MNAALVRIAQQTKLRFNYFLVCMVFSVCIFPLVLLAWIAAILCACKNRGVDQPCINQGTMTPIVSETFVFHELEP